MTKMLLGGYISFWIGMTIAKVGDMPEAPFEPYTWGLPLAMAATLLPVAVLAYLAGKEDA